MTDEPKRDAERDAQLPVRVVIAEDSGLLREGLSRLLSDAASRWSPPSATARGWCSAVEEHRPDVAVVDVRMPPDYRDEGLKAAIEARGRVPGLPVLVLSQYVEERYGAELLESGARGTGYLLKDRVADVPEFVAAVRDVASGGTVLDPEVVEQPLPPPARRGARRPSPRVSAKSWPSWPKDARNHAIAGTLFVTDGAVEKHVKSIFGKLGLAQTGTDHRRVLAVLAYLRA